MESSGGNATAGQLDLISAARLAAAEALRALDSSSGGLTGAEGHTRLEKIGPNTLQAHGVRALAVFASQLRSPFLLLLLATAVASVFFGERTDALIIFLISGLSVGLGFVSEIPLSSCRRRPPLETPAHDRRAPRR